MVNVPDEGARVLDALTAAIRGVLGPDQVGLYLYGSAVTGGFDPGVSDLDLVAVTRRSAPELDLDALRVMHERFEAERPAWRGRIEVAYVGEDDVRAFQTTTGRLAVISPGESLHLREDPLGDWAANWYLVREVGVALAGPPPSVVMPPVERAEFVAGIRRYADEVWNRDRSGAHVGEIAYELLTLARALMLTTTGTAGSKQEAAAWAAERMPACAPVLDEALACRRSGGRTGFDAATRPAAEACIERLHAALARPAGDPG